MSKDRDKFLQAISWQLGVSVEYVRCHYEDYLHVYDFNAFHFYNIVKMFNEVDNGKIATKKGFK